MSPKMTRILIVVLVAVLAAGGAAAVVSLVNQKRIADLETRLADRDERIAVLQATADSLTAAAASTTQAPPATSPAPEDAAEPDAPVSKTVRQYAFVTAATESGGVISLTLDYAEFLTGDAAAEAAAAAGDESPPPNDYYIANTNPKLRKHTVASGAKFKIAFDTPEDTRTLGAGEFLDAFVADSDGVRNAGYWVTITGDKITGAEEQWLP